MKRFFPALAVSAPAVFALAACSMSGLGSHSSYACQAPEGVSCESVSGIYANALANNLPARRNNKNAKQPADAPPRFVPLPVEPAGAALRSPAHYLRLWMKPWVDIDGDLYDHAYLYVQINEGRWQVDHIARPLEGRPPPLRAPKEASDASSSTTAQPRASIPSQPAPFNSGIPNKARP